MDDAEFVHLLGGVDRSVEDHPLGLGRAQAAGEEAVRPHAGEQAEARLRQAEAGPPLGHHDVERQQRLEAAAQGVPLRQADGHQRQVEADHVAVEDADAGAAVVRQRLAVARPDAVGEQGEIPAEAENAREPRAEHEVAQVAARPEHPHDLGLPSLEILQHRRVEGRAADRVHEGPERRPLLVPGDVELPEMEQLCVERRSRDRAVGARQEARNQLGLVKRLCTVKRTRKPHSHPQATC